MKKRILRTIVMISMVATIGLLCGCANQQNTTEGINGKNTDHEVFVSEVDDSMAKNLPVFHIETTIENERPLKTRPFIRR